MANIQLILYPQDVQGYSFTTVPNFTEQVANKNFNINLANSHSLNGSPNNGPNWGRHLVQSFTVNSTGCFRGFYAGTTSSDNYFNVSAAPSINTTTQQLTLNYVSGSAIYGSINGVFQTLQNLTFGQQYTLKFKHSEASGGEFWIGIPNYAGVNYVNFVIGSTGSYTPITPAFGDTETTFDFTHTNSLSGMAHLFIAYVRNSGNGSITLTEISIKEKEGTAPLLITSLNDGQVICDLYEDEDIPLTLSVDNFTNIAEKTQSYSKDFNIPATKRNNKIFTHIFDIQKRISTAFDFNPYVQTKAVLKQEGAVIFEGFLKLIDIQDKEGEISYNVNLYSSSVSLKDILDARKFSDLSEQLKELEHEYNYNNIVNSWEGILDLLSPIENNGTTTWSAAGVDGATTTNVLKYPFCDWTGNIDCSGSLPELSVLEDAFRPWIQCKYLLDNIFHYAGFTFQSSVFEGTEFGKLYMDFNWGNESAPLDFTHTGRAEYHHFTDGLNTAGAFPTYNTLFFTHDGGDSFDSDTGWDSTTSKFVCQNDNTLYNLHYYVLLESNNTNAEAKIAWRKTDASGATSFPFGYQQISPGDWTTLQSTTGNQILAAKVRQVAITLDTNEQLELMFSSTTNASYEVKQAQLPDTLHSSFECCSQYPESYIRGSVSNDANMITSTMLNALRGDLGQWEFVSSLMKMFNLVSLQDPGNPTNIIFEPYHEIFVEESPTVVNSTVRNWTEKIDTKDIKLSPIDLKRFVHFKYNNDEEDYPLQVYKEGTGKDYGSKIIDGSSALQGTNQVTNLVGKEEVVAEAFSATLIKPIHPTFAELIIPVIYGSDNGWQFDGIDNAPRILYNGYRKPASYIVPGQNGVAGGTKTDYLSFSHTSLIPSNIGDVDFNFGECQFVLGVGDPPTNNLYNTYYRPYYDELYDPNTRTFECKVNLNAADINTFKFYDKVRIKNQMFRVNKIDYRPNGLSKVEFILLP